MVTILDRIGLGKSMSRWTLLDEKKTYSVLQLQDGSKGTNLIERMKDLNKHYSRESNH